MNRLRFETRFSGRGLHELRGVGQFEVDQFSTIVADRVIVTFDFAIVAAGAVSEIDFKHQARVFQITQGVVNGGIADTGQTNSCRLKDIAGRRVVVALLNYLEYCFPLRSQLWFFPGYFHSGLRLILIPRFVKRGALSGLRRI